MRSMRKPALMLALVAVAALAVPAMASASEARLKTSSTEYRASVGTSLTFSGSPVLVQNNLLGSISCSSWALGGVLTKNDSTTVEAAGSGLTATGCLNYGKTITFSNMKWERLYTSTSGQGTLTLSYTHNFASYPCAYSGTVPFTYQPGSSTITFNSAAGITGSPKGCGTEKLSGTFGITSGSASLILY